ncbi:hypothetical protein OHA04_27795 [Streptomyces sp. NBC_01590]|uniref:hypothetical protein n=1 Tax=Streptomyces sp. NBC_01590 TaxID=2975887 RepID=UPI0038656413
MKCAQFRHALAAVAVGAVVLTGCSGGEETGAGKGSASQAAEKPADKPTTAEAGKAAKDVRIVKAGVEDHQTWGPKAYVVHYSATNSGAEAADLYAELEFLDKDGDHLGQTGITVDKLGPGKTATGNTAPLDAEIRNGKIADIRSVRVSQVDRTASAKQ